MLTPKEVPSPGAQKCPKCGKQALSFNPEQNVLRCSACGFERRLQS